MALATQCPMCETVFRITTAQAAVKSGTVRCGHCFSVFNALDVLVRVEDLEFDRDVPPVDDDEPDAVEAHTTPVGPPLEDHAETPLTPQADHVETEPVAEGLDPPDSPATVREWWLPAEGESIVTAPSDPARGAPAETSLAERRLHLGWPQTRNRERLLDRDGETRPARSRAERVVLSMLSLVAVLALIAQATYAWRDEIAARWPATRTPLETACASLGCKLQYPMHLDAITIESTNVEATAPNSTTFVLTTLLRNRDPVDVRYPSLSLTLTDAQDQPILRRVLRPEDYLAPDRLSRGFSAESELPIRVTFTISELRFLGYRLERFYP